MAKRKFRIEAGRYGGELTIGEINADFVDYWLEQDDEGELIQLPLTYTRQKTHSGN